MIHGDGMPLTNYASIFVLFMVVAKLGLERSFDEWIDMYVVFNSS